MVCDTTEAYFADQDLLQQWLDDCTYDAGPPRLYPHSRPVRQLEDVVRGS